MQEEQSKNKTIKTILILAFSFLAVVLFFILDSRKKSHEQEHLKLLTERYQHAYNTIYNQYEQLATNIYSGLLARFTIQEVYQKLLTADEEQKNKLRQELLDQIKHRFTKLQKEGLVQYLHFHLPDNESFLRLHRPKKFGDDLTEIRQTVEFVNNEHETVNGFEDGRMSGAYRFVFPITGIDQTHLGSMEISFGPEVITSSIMKQYYVLSNFFVLKGIAIRKAFPTELYSLYTESHHKGYYYNKKVLAELKQISRKDIKTLKPQKNITNAIYNNAQNDRAVSLYDPATDMVFTTMPVFNPVTHERVAFCTVRSKSDFFINETQHFKLTVVIGLLLLIMTFLTFYVQYNKHSILKSHSNKLEKQQHELLKTQKALQQERDMFMSGPVVTFTWLNNEHWSVEQVSENVIEIFGYSAEEFLNGSVQYIKLIHPEDLQHVTDEVATNSMLESSRSFTHDPYRLISRTGEIIWVLDSTMLVRNAQGDISHYQGYLVDITKMVLMEKEVVATKDRLKINQQKEQLKRFESLKTMAGAIAHRFNNAMMVVNGNLELVTATLPDKSKEYQMVSDALQAAKGATQVGSMMLSYVGQQPCKLRDVSIEPLVKESITTLSGSSPSTITLKLTPPVQDLYCAIDRLQIKEVIESLMANAIESLGDSAGTIEITFGTDYFTVDSFPIPFQNDKLQDGMYTFCQIKDSGHGISPNDISRIFEPFYTTRFVGRGLGLAMTVGIMQSHHGAITVESVSGQGTSVRMLLPSFPSTQQTTPAGDGVVQSDILQLSGNILLADDEKMVLDVGRKMLEALGFTVHVASNGQEAVDMANSQDIEFCAAVLDISMPEIDGIEAMRTIREINPTLPILLSSGYSEDNFPFKEDQGGRPDSFLSKPFRLSDMRSSLKKLLS